MAESSRCVWPDICKLEAHDATHQAMFDIRQNTDNLFIWHALCNNLQGALSATYHEKWTRKVGANHTSNGAPHQAEPKGNFTIIFMHPMSVQSRCVNA